MTAIPLPRPEEVDYPESDGKPMAETEVHWDEMVYLAGALKERFREQADVYVGSDMCFYYVQGDPKKYVAPDVFVVHGIPKLPKGQKRRIYKLWEEGHPPSLVIEVTSASTKDEDLLKKRPLYERIGVEEYFLHDPLGEYLDPKLQGFRLIAGRYQPMRPQRDGSLLSRTTGVLLKPEGQGVRLIDAATGQPLLTYEEIAESKRAAEGELARLRAEIERLRETG